jgi:hypothetical protein
MSRTRPAALSVSEVPELDEVWEAARPVVAATERLRSVIEEAKIERSRSVSALRRAVLELGHDCPPEHRAELAQALYWHHAEVPITDIYVAFGYDQSSLSGAIGRVRTSARCEDCDTTLVASSRRQLTELEKIAAKGSSRYGPRALSRRCNDRRDRAIYVHPPDDLYDDCESWGEPPLAV